MPFVQAICPECGGILEIDASKEAAICKYCGNALLFRLLLTTISPTISQITPIIISMAKVPWLIFMNTNQKILLSRGVF